MSDKIKGKLKDLVIKDKRVEKKEKEIEQGSKVEKLQEYNVNDIPHENIDSILNANVIPDYSSEIGSIYLNRESKKIDAFRTSFIDKGEEGKAKQVIEEYLGFEAPRVTGFHMAVKIYVSEDEVVNVKGQDGVERQIYLPKTQNAHDKFKNCSALVLSQGSDCYKGKHFEEHWFRRFSRIFFNRWMEPNRKLPWCKVGDWVVIGRNEGPQINYRGIPVTLIPDNKIFCVIEDPKHVTRD